MFLLVRLFKKPVNMSIINGTVSTSSYQLARYIHPEQCGKQYDDNQLQLGLKQNHGILKKKFMLHSEMIWEKAERHSEGVADGTWVHGYLDGGDMDESDTLSELWWSYFKPNKISWDDYVKEYCDWWKQEKHKQDKERRLKKNLKSYFPPCQII